MKYVLQQQLVYSFTWSSNQFHILNIFSFLFLKTFLLINSISLCFDPYTFCHLQAVRIYNLFPSFWRSVLAVFCAFLDAVHAGYRAYKPCHVPHASPITTSGTIFTEICFGVQGISPILVARFLDN